MNGSSGYISDRRLYLNADGQVVEATDPGKVTLLVGKGGSIPMVEAERLGLLNEPQAPAQEQAVVEQAPVTAKDDDKPNKAQTRAPQNKAT